MTSLEVFQLPLDTASRTPARDGWFTPHCDWT